MSALLQVNQTQEKEDYPELPRLADIPPDVMELYREQVRSHFKHDVSSMDDYVRRIYGLTIGLNEGNSWFYWQIKARSTAGDWWEWPPRKSGRVQAENAKKARLLLDELLGESLPMRSGKGEPTFLLSIEKINPLENRYDLRFIVKHCVICSSHYSMNDIYDLGTGGNETCCSRQCKDASKIDDNTPYTIDEFSFRRNRKAFIYQIKQRSTGKYYIGKTTQPFTLRWYQHMYHPKGTSFHQAIKASTYEDWEFSIVEVVLWEKEVAPHDFAAVVAEVEQKWIDKLDAKNPDKGFNTADANKKTAIGPNGELQFEDDSLTIVPEKSVVK